MFFIARDLGARCVVFPHMRDAAHRNLVEAVRDKHPNASQRKLYKFVQEAEDRLEQLLDDLDHEDPPCSREEIKSARQRFEDDHADLASLVSYDKDPIPEDEDLRIMVQASKLTDGTVFILSRDAHFTGYAGKLKDRWGFEVVPGDRLPFVREAWRGSEP